MRQISSKPDTYTERMDVYVAGITFLLQYLEGSSW
jgi:hypothetical protein